MSHTTPLAVPSNLNSPSEIGRSVTLVDLGSDAMLHESEVWNLSPTMKWFSSIESTLLRRRWTAHFPDLILDISSTFVSVVFNYADPFLLKRVLDAIDLEYPTLESQTREYIYAFLAFPCTLLKTRADVQLLWYARRASTRIRSDHGGDI